MSAAFRLPVTPEDDAAFDAMTHCHLDLRGAKPQPNELRIISQISDLLQQLRQAPHAGWHPVLYATDGSHRVALVASIPPVRDVYYVGDWPDGHWRDIHGERVVPILCKSYDEGRA